MNRVHINIWGGTNVTEDDKLLRVFFVTRALVS